MERGKIVSAALLLTVAGAMLIMPPLALVFQWHMRLFGLPVAVIYIFVVWAALVAGARALARRMPADPPSAGEDGGGAG